MEAVANNPAFAKKTGVPQSVGKEFSNADKGRKFSKGGDMATKMNPAFKAMIEKKKAGAKADMPMKKGGAAKKMNMGGMGYAKGGVTRADGVVSKGHTKGTQVTMKNGGKC